jgi:AAA family ATP:ADP antiporter
VFTSVMLSYHGVGVMPLAYVGIAISAVFVQTITSRYSGQTSLIKLIYYNHIIQFSILVFISVLIYSGLLGHWVSLGLYIYISIFALVTVTYFYQYCQSLLTIRDAKRIYAFIGSGAIAGGVFGGYFTSALVPHIGNLGLVIFSAIFLGVSGLIINIIDKNYREDEANSIHTRESQTRPKQQLSLFNNDHVRNIAMIIGLGVVVSKLVDYQFNFLAFDNIIGQDNLTSFFGFWFSTINVVGLLFQMLIVSKVVDRLGVSRSIAVMPFFLLIGSGLLLVFPILAFGVVVKLMEGSLKQSLYKTSTEINIMPLTSGLRNRAKTFVDVVVDSFATGLVGVVIYIFINKAALPFYFIGIITIATTCLWIYSIYRSSHTYKAELSRMVKGDHMPLNESERIGTTAKRMVLDQYLTQHKTKGKNAKQLLLELTSHVDANIRKSAILRYVKNYGLASISDLSHCTEDPSLLVRKAVFFAYIMKARTEKQIDDLYIGMDTKNFVIVTAALAEAIGNNTKQKTLFSLNDRIDEAHDRLVFEKHTEDVEKLFGQIYRAITICKYLKRYSLIIDAIRNPENEKLQKESLRAIAYGKARRIFDLLGLEDIAEENLQSYYKTLSVFPIKLLIKAKSLIVRRSNKINSLLPAFEYIDQQEHLDFLFTLLDHPRLKTRRTALRIINKLRKKFNHLSFENKSNRRRLNFEVKHLKKLAAAKIFIQELQMKNEDSVIYKTINDINKVLNRQINRSVMSTFIYMALISEKDELSMIYQAIKSTRKDAALDLLDGIIEYRIRKNLIPVLEVVVHKRFTVEDLRSINQRPMNLRSFKYLVKEIKDERLIKLAESIR